MYIRSNWDDLFFFVFFFTWCPPVGRGVSCLGLFFSLFLIIIILFFHLLLASFLFCLSFVCILLATFPVISFVFVPLFLSRFILSSSFFSNFISHLSRFFPSLLSSSLLLLASFFTQLLSTCTLFLLQFFFSQLFFHHSQTRERAISEAATGGPYVKGFHGNTDKSSCIIQKKFLQ